MVVQLNRKRDDGDRRPFLAMTPEQVRQVLFIARERNLIDTGLTRGALRAASTNRLLPTMASAARSMLQRSGTGMGRIAIDIRAAGYSKLAMRAWHFVTTIGLKKNSSQQDEV